MTENAAATGAILCCRCTGKMKIPSWLNVPEHAAVNLHYLRASGDWPACCVTLCTGLQQPRVTELQVACTSPHNALDCAGPAPQAGRDESYSEEGTKAILEQPQEDAQVASSGCKQS